MMRFEEHRGGRQSDGPRIEQFAAAISKYAARGGRVLEVGAGEGFLAAALVQSGYSVVALDPHLRSTFPIIEMSFEQFEAPARSFDCIAAQLVLHHVPALDQFLDKACKFLKPEGVIAIDDYGWERSEDPAFRAERADFHTSRAMLDALRSRFSQLYYADHAYYAGGTDNIAFTFAGAPVKD